MLFGKCRQIFAACIMLVIMAGCAGHRIAIKEKFGYAKREQLTDRVQDARDDQVEAKKQFESALKQFLEVTKVADSELSGLEKRYDKLKSEYERSESRAQDVSDRIKSVQHVANALFKEWREELNQYTNQNLRRSSEEQLQATRKQYDRLIEVMKAAEARMPPVLSAFRDQVLFLKHNLNARAISSLQQNAGQIESDVTRLVEDMEAAISEANVFIAQMLAAK